MAEKKEELVWRSVFMYLNTTDLNNIAKVSSSWEKYVMDEILLRSPVCITKSQVMKDNGDSWSRERNNVVALYYRRPCIQIFYSNDSRGPNFGGCHCLFSKRGNYSLISGFKYPVNHANENMLSGLLLPLTGHIKIATFTFIEGLFTDGLFCQEIRFNCGRNLGEVKFLRLKLAPFFANKNTHTCVITICKKKNVLGLMDFFQAVYDWFPENNIIGMWGSIIDTLYSCQVVYNKKFCSVDTEFTVFLISSPLMQVWTELLDENDDTLQAVSQKLTAFKEDITFKSHSVAFIQINAPRFTKYCKTDVDIFKEIFPDLFVYHAVGISVLHGKCFYDFMNNFPKRSITTTTPITSILIITYS